MNISQLLTKLKTLVYSKSETDSLLGGKASSSHTHTKSQITDFPTIPSKVSQLTNDSGFITGVSWANVSGKPSTFTPSSHTHTKSQITDFPSLATVATSGSYNDLSNKPTIPTNTNQLTNGAGFITSSGSCSYSTTSGTSTYSTYLKSLGAQTPKSGRDIFHSGVYTYTTYTDTNTPAHYGAVIGYGNGQGGSCEMFAEWVGKGKLWFRVLRDCIDSWTDWQQIITSDNIGSQSVNYANSAGSVAWGNVSGKPSTFTPSSHTHTKSQITDFPTIPTNTNQLTNGAGFITSSGSCNYANSAGSAGKADHLGDIGSTDRNSASGTGWYSVGFSYSYDEGHGELAINNYWGIRINCRDSSHVTINGNRIIDSGNTGNISISGYQVYVG